MIKNILFDFDGVILDSMPIRDKGFETVLSKYGENKIEELMEYHRYNAGLSRFVKIRYFFEELLGKEINEKKVQELALEFSKMMKEELVNPKYLINETVEFIKKNHKNYKFHIVSGSEEKELNFLCETLGIDNYFITIEGSPTHKNDLVKNLMEKYNYSKKETILIGDSITDYEASKANSIDFYGYNNNDLAKYSKKYIETFKKF